MLGGKASKKTTDDTAMLEKMLVKALTLDVLYTYGDGGVTWLDMSADEGSARARRDSSENG